MRQRHQPRTVTAFEISALLSIGMMFCFVFFPFLNKSKLGNSVKKYPSYKNAPPEEYVIGLNFSEDASQLIVHEAGGRLRVWDVKNSRFGHEFRPHFAYHKASTADHVAVCFLSPNRLVTTFSGKSTVWDIERGKQIYGGSRHIDEAIIQVNYWMWTTHDPLMDTNPIVHSLSRNGRIWVVMRSTVAGHSEDVFDGQNGIPLEQRRGLASIEVHRSIDSNVVNRRAGKPISKWIFPTTPDYSFGGMSDQSPIVVSDTGAYVAIISRLAVFVFDNQGNQVAHVSPPIDTGFKSSYECMQFGTDEQIALAGAGGSVVVYNWKTGRHWETIIPEFNQVKSLAIRNKYVAVGDSGKFAVLEIFKDNLLIKDYHVESNDEVKN